MSRRYVDLAIRVCLAEVDRDGNGRQRWKPGSDVEITCIGGRYDVRTKRWSKASPKTILTIRFHRGQWDAARWFAEWLARFVRNDWTNYRRAWSALLIGGRRSGKTHLAIAFLVIFGVLHPGAIIWALSPTLDTGDELDGDLRAMLPKGWYVRKQAKTGRPTTFRLANGARILLKSAVKPKRLKAGRVDMVLLNEAQELEQLAYLKVRAPIADRGGIVLMTANPPDTEAGRWVEGHYLKAKAGEIEGVVFELSPLDNPWLTHEALASIRTEVDDVKLFERDVLGLFPAIGDVVFTKYDPIANFADPEPHLIDVTAEVTRRALGRAAGDLCGQDFQATPAMVAAILRVFRDPNDPARGEILWVVDEVIVPDSDEGELLDELETMPRWEMGDGAPESREERRGYRGWIESTDDKDRHPQHTAVICDASGWSQDGAHAKGETSEKWLRARRWGHLYKPQKDSDKNPIVRERMKSGNALLRDRRLMIARHCTKTADAFRRYPNDKWGKPNRKHELAHIIDAVTYVGYRLYGVPPAKKTRSKYRGLGRNDRAEQLASY